MSRRRKRRNPIIGLSFFLLFCICLALYFFMNSAFFNLQKIIVEDCPHLEVETVKELSGLTIGSNIFKIDKQKTIAKLTLHPIIKRVQISRKIPQTVVIKIKERTPVALVMGPESYLVIDEEGVYIKQVTALQDFDLPVISGIALPEQVALGEKLERDGLSAALQLVALMEVDFLEKVAEIEAATPYNLVLKMLQGVKIHFGSVDEIERKLRTIQELLVENEELINQQTVEYIDLRYQSLPVIKRKK